MTVAYGIGPDKAGQGVQMPMAERQEHRAPDSVIELQRHFRFQWEPAQQAHVLLYPEGMVKLPGSAGEIMKRSTERPRRRS